MNIHKQIIQRLNSWEVNRFSGNQTEDLCQVSMDLQPIKCTLSNIKIKKDGFVQYFAFLRDDSCMPYFQRMLLTW